MDLQTIFETIATLGHDEDFEGQPNELFFPTMFSPGSEQKIEVLRQRLELGLPLWHPEDENRCTVLGMGEKKNATSLGRPAEYHSARRSKMLSD